MRDFLAECDPDANPHFRRRWEDAPLGLPEFQYLGREIAPRVAEDAARRAIARWLDKAAQTQGRKAFEAFKEADSIRRKMGLAWGEMIDAPRAA